MSEEMPTSCSCHGACCRSYLVNVCGYDIWRISTSRRLAPEHFLVPLVQDEPNADGFLLQRGGPAYGLALDKRGRFGVKRPCVFLLELGGGVGRCGIYPDRPFVCQTYPLDIWQGQVFQRQRVLCPPGSWPAAELQRPSRRQTLQRQRMHFDLYSELVARWNARVAAAGDAAFGLEEYLAYLMNVYDGLARLTSQRGEARLAAAEASWPNVPRSGDDNPAPEASGGPPPWLDYLLATRQVIDHFYPELAPLPLLSLLAAPISPQHPTAPDALPSNPPPRRSPIGGPPPAPAAVAVQGRRPVC